MQSLKMTPVFLKVFFILYLIGMTKSKNSDDESGLSLIGTALASYTPCADGILIMTRESGRPPSRDNYWEGSLNLMDFKKYGEARIKLTLDTEATISLDPEIADIHAQNTTFYMATYGVPDHLKFLVEAPRNKPFPNVHSVTINGLKRCKKMNEKWYPHLADQNGIALGVVSSSDFKPYCGRKQLEHTKLIVEGQPTERGDWPWHAALYHYNTTINKHGYQCGGTLISSTAVVTAAHCVTSGTITMPKDLLLVELGKYMLNTEERGSQKRQVSSINIFDNYDATFLRNDIAIIRFEEVAFSQFIQPICLWPENDLLKDYIFGTNATVVGWGINEHDVVSQQLNEVNMPVASDLECLLSYSAFFEKYLTNTTFCAGNKNGASVCNGDSGGGLVIGRLEPDNKISWYLRGIVSISARRLDKNVCDPNHFVIFTDTAGYREFLNKHRFN